MSYAPVMETDPVMSKHVETASAIRRLIRDQQLKPGDPLPSERAIANQLGTSYGVVRMANDALSRAGVIERRHGQGTFVASPAPTVPGSGRHRRLGLLSVDMSRTFSPYSQHLMFAIQACAHRVGYEVTIEQMHTEDLMVGQVPEMIRRRSVDAVILDGRVTEAHLRFLERHDMLAVVTGTLPLGPDVPQVRTDVYGLCRQLAGQLRTAGYGPVWLDVDTERTDVYFAGSELLRGYMDEVRQSPGDTGAMHLCTINPQRVQTTIDQLAASDLGGAACIVENWAWSMVADGLALRTPESEQLLFVPWPSHQTTQFRPSRRYLHWQRTMSVDWIARPAVEGLVAVLEGDQPFFQSVSLSMSCELNLAAGSPEGHLSCVEVPFGPRFSVERFGEGAIWRSDETGAPDDSTMAGVSSGAVAAPGLADGAGELEPGMAKGNGS